MDPGLGAALRAALPGVVDDSRRRRAEYAADASNYRHVPAAVVFPRSADEVAAALAVAATHGAPVTMRGGGTSVGGSAIGPGVVLDCSRHFGRILELDPATRTVRVEPGLVLARLQGAAAPHGLRFGPDPSTGSRATLGGMIGNNACGSRSLTWGSTGAQVQALDVLLADGTRLQVGPTPEPELAALAGAGGRRGALYRGLRELRDRHGDGIRAGLGRFSRQMSGYALQNLLPEHGFDLAKALVGTEGSCAVLLGATLSLVPSPPARVLLVLGFADLADAADVVPHLLADPELRPLTCEGLDTALLPPGIDPGAGGLPGGHGWLLLEFGAATTSGAERTARAAATRLGGDARVVDSRVVTDQGAQAVLWRIREDGAGLATRVAGPAGAGGAAGVEAWPGWEDAAVPPERLGSYLRGFRALMARHGRRGVLYGHFGEGCLHVRIDFDLASPAGIAAHREFVLEAADLVAAHGGSASGEHGDGQARSELLPRFFDPDLLAAFAEFKAAFDPAGMLNPGIVVAPRRLDADLRWAPPVRDDAPEGPSGMTSRTPRSLPLAFAYSADGGDLARAARRCVGVARCRTDAGGVMCPSYRATGDEKDSTRGRARVLQEMLRGELIEGGWRSSEVRDALDLCLACKGCRSDCPVGVDMATYKAEFLHQHYRGRPRPAAHWSMGWLPLWARLGAPVAPVLNAATRSRPLGAALRRAGGLTDARPIPALARPLRLPRAVGPAGGPRVALWVDSFTAAFAPELAARALDVLAAAGLRVLVVPGRPCCALTWVTSGQLGVARRVLRRTLGRLAPAAAAGIPVVGLEPSCTAALRADLPELLPGDQRAGAVAGAVRTVAEVLAEHAPGWRPPGAAALADREPALVQVHCHQHAVLGFDADAALLARLGVRHTVLDAGCCGLAGAFGFEREHYEVSVAVARTGLLPALAAGPAAPVLADGFSCRTQVAHLTGRRTEHLVDLLHAALR